jgi:molecular chaperone GrpE
MNDTLEMEKTQEELPAAADEQVTAAAPEDAPEAAATEDAATTIARLEAALAEEQAKANDLLDKNQRMAAEFQNSRRRQERQLAEEIERANAHMIRRLLPVVDDFDLAFANTPGRPGCW